MSERIKKASARPNDMSESDAPPPINNSPAEANRGPLTKFQFVKNYAERSGITEDQLMKNQVALPCDCGHEKCEGWAMVQNNRESIETHNDLYSPNTRIKVPTQTTENNQTMKWSR